MKLFIYKLIDNNTKNPKLIKEICEAEAKAKTYQIVGESPKHYNNNRVFKNVIGKAIDDGTVVILTEENLAAAKIAFREYYKSIIRMHQSFVDTAQRKLNVINDTEGI